MALDPKAQAELADMMLALAHNPKTRSQVARLAKTAGIPVTFNDVEASDAALAAAGKVAKDAIEEDRATQRNEEIRRRTEASRTGLIAAGRFTEAQVKDELEPFMQERGIGSYEDAAVLYNHAHPSSAPHSEIAQGHLWQMPQGNWIKDPHGMARQEAHKAIAEIAAARR